MFRWLVKSRLAALFGMSAREQEYSADILAVSRRDILHITDLIAAPGITARDKWGNLGEIIHRTMEAAEIGGRNDTGLWLAMARIGAAMNESYQSDDGMVHLNADDADTIKLLSGCIRDAAEALHNGFWDETIVSINTRRPPFRVDIESDTIIFDKNFKEPLRIKDRAPLDGILEEEDYRRTSVNIQLVGEALINLLQREFQAPRNRQAAIKRSYRPHIS